MLSFATMQMLYVLIVAIGIGVSIDGMLSAIVPTNHHSFWFDLERYIRATAGVALIISGYALLSL
jgi:hypothetical protein